MTPDTAAVVIAAIAFGVTFTAARILGRGFRERRRQRKDAERQAKQRLGESRQVRRARERRERR